MLVNGNRRSRKGPNHTQVMPKRKRRMQNRVRRRRRRLARKSDRHDDVQSIVGVSLRALAGQKMQREPKQKKWNWSSRDTCNYTWTYFGARTDRSALMHCSHNLPATAFFFFFFVITECKSFSVCARRDRTAPAKRSSTKATPIRQHKNTANIFLHNSGDTVTSVTSARSAMATAAAAPVIRCRFTIRSHSVDEKSNNNNSFVFRLRFIYILHVSPFRRSPPESRWANKRKLWCECARETRRWV